eukprot:511841-Amphidinium_carterae.1
MTIVLKCLRSPRPLKRCGLSSQEYALVVSADMNREICSCKEVMKDWHSSVVSPGGEVSATAAAAWQRQAEVMVYGEELAGQSLQSHVKPKLANRDRC